jgi:inhibitor of cysteine peptidase
MYSRKGLVPVMAFGLIVIIALGIVVTTQLILPGSTQGLKQFSSCDQIKSFLSENQGGYDYYGGIMGTAVMRQTSDLGGMAPAAAGAEKSDGGAEEYSTTNIQVEGVDEPDIVKNDGKYIYAVSGSQVFIIDAYPAEGARLLSTINSTGVTNIFVNGDRLVVFGNNYSYPEEPVMEKVGIAMPGYYPYSQLTYASVYDISDRSSPVPVNGFSIEGYYSDARMIGDYVYLITSKGVSYGDGPVPLPVVYAESGSRPACGCADLYYFDVPDYSYQFVTIASLNLADDSAGPDTKVIMSGYTSTVFVSQENIYLSYIKRISWREQNRRVYEAVKAALPAQLRAQIELAGGQEDMEKMGEIIQDYYNTLSEGEKAAFMEDVQDAVQAAYAEMQKDTQRTVIQKIGISSGSMEYAGSGEVPGRLLNQFSMDEHNGYLRAATTVDATWNWRGGQSSPSVNNVYVLDSGMAVVGKLEDLAPGESIYSARFMGDRAYLVTFKRVDPLFVIGLSDPANPALLGKLKIPGYSDYLHPYDEDHLIGIGKEVDPSIDADKVHEDEAVYYTAILGVKLSLFDVTDVSAPKEIAKYVIGDRGTESLATSDHKAFLFDREKGLLVIPILLAELKPNQDPESGSYGEYTFQGAYVFSLNPEDGFTYRGRITHADNATEKGYYWYSPFTIQRSLYIGDSLYTVSPGMVKANALSDLSELAKISLPVESQTYPYPLRDVATGGTGKTVDVPESE